MGVIQTYISKTMTSSHSGAHLITILRICRLKKAHFQEKVEHALLKASLQKAPLFHEGFADSEARQLPHTEKMGIKSKGRTLHKSSFEAAPFMIPQSCCSFGGVSPETFYNWTEDLDFRKLFSYSTWKKKVFEVDNSLSPSPHILKPSLKLCGSIK